MIIKILLIIAVVALGALVLRERFPGQRQAARRLISLLVAVAAIIAILWPDSTTQLAHLVGVGRGTDLLFYLSVVAWLFSMVAMSQQIFHLENRITDLTRALALRDEVSRVDRKEEK